MYVQNQTYIHKIHILIYTIYLIWKMGFWWQRIIKTSLIWWLFVYKYIIYNISFGLSFESQCLAKPCMAVACLTLGLSLSYQCSSGTLTYIQSQCQEALSNLHTDPETGSHSLLALLPTTLQHCEEIHNEVGTWWCVLTCMSISICGCFAWLHTHLSVVFAWFRVRVCVTVDNVSALWNLCRC